METNSIKHYVCCFQNILDLLSKAPVRICLNPRKYNYLKNDLREANQMGVIKDIEL